MKVLYNGLGETSGDSLALAGTPFQTSGNVWWVLSTIGSDAASPAGQDREKPLATLAQAVTNSADGDTIVLRAGHIETRTTAITINKSLTIVGGGTQTVTVNGVATVVPGVTLKANAAGIQLLNITAASVELRGIYFPENLQSNSGSARVDISGAQCQVNGCYFAAGSLDIQVTMRVTAGGDRLRVENCTFVSTATTTTRPVAGIQLAAALSGVELKDVVFDEGSFGWSAQAFVESATQTNSRMLGVTLLNGAKFVKGSSSTGYVGLKRSTSASSVLW